MPQLKEIEMKDITKDFSIEEATRKSPIAVLAAAERKIEEKFQAEGGEAKLGPRVERSLGSLWRFPSSAICYDVDTGRAYFMFGDIYKKWDAAGGMRFGTPCTDTITAGDGVARYQNFLGGRASIYWTPTARACLVYGAIRDRWLELGGEGSYLGYPVGDEVEFDEQGRASEFEHGGIYHWSDTGPIDLRDVVVHYTGLRCFGETDADQFDFLTNKADEPYVLFALSTPKQNWTARTRIYENVDSGETRVAGIELYRGRPYGLVVGIALMEHDLGDPNKYLKTIQDALMKVHEIGTAALGLIPIVGPAVAAVAGPALGALMPEIGTALNEALDTGDDRIGTATVTLRARDMVLLAARTQNSQSGQIGFKVESPLISGDGASYKVYFGVVPA